MALAQQTPLVQLVNISKQFPGVLAVDTVSLDIFPGEVHVVAGENGAGQFQSQTESEARHGQPADRYHVL